MQPNKKLADQSDRLARQELVTKTEPFRQTLHGIRRLCQKLFEESGLRCCFIFIGRRRLQGSSKDAALVEQHISKLHSVSAKVHHHIFVVETQVAPGFSSGENHRK